MRETIKHELSQHCQAFRGSAEILYSFTKYSEHWKIDDRERKDKNKKIFCITVSHSGEENFEKFRQPSAH